ncbi:MAG: ABC transporter substrate-binding protein [Hyphomicrobiales bacterium]|nr:ABC transporter substrate-binding protein [Hyphomicrobiales bacterium]
MKTHARSVRRTVAVFAALAGMSGAAHAELAKVRFAYLKTLDLMPFFYGQEKGYFKDEGIDLDLIAVPGGPAVGAALASGSADIGYAAPTPILIAREQGQPFKFFMSLEYEQTPQRLWGSMIATEKSGIKSIKDLAGKTIATGVPGGLCELAARDWMASAGVTYDASKALNNPFPQMPAMLDLGTADAACIVEPFATAALAGKSHPIVLGKGYLAHVTQPYRVSALFATDSWIASHKKEIGEIMKAYTRAARELGSNNALVKEILLKEYRFPPQLVDKLNIEFALDNEPKPQDYKIIIDKMEKYGMLKKPMSPEDVIAAH